MKNYLLFLVIPAFIFVGCEKSAEETEAEKVKKSSIFKGLEIVDAWIRPASKGTNTALFFKAVNNTKLDDTLFAAISNLAELTEVHETYKTGENIMGMRHVDFVPIPAGETVEFKPRDLHIMFIKLDGDVNIGEEKEAVLKFKKAGDIMVKAEVRDFPIKLMNR